MKKTNYLPWMAMAGVVASLAIAVPVFAETSAGASAVQKGRGGIGEMRGGEASGVTGTVSAINGTTLTVTSKGMMRPEPMHEASGTKSTAAATTTVYTVNASSATVYKNNVTSTVASIATGDTVMVQGTVSGTSVTATVIRDGVGDAKGSARGASSTLPTSTIKGNGEPVVGGNITAINGTTLTITNESNVTYAVDASSATIVKGNATSSISSVAIGDGVVVQGMVNGNAITASSIIDQGAKGKSTSHGNFVSGIFGAIGGFFSHLFGF